MLKNFASFVLISQESSTGTRPPHYSPAALPAERRVSARRGWAGETSNLFEHPAENSPVILDMRISEVPACLLSFSEA
jgi:hypothetical protein